MLRRLVVEEMYKREKQDQHLGGTHPAFSPHAQSPLPLVTADYTYIHAYVQGQAAGAATFDGAAEASAQSRRGALSGPVQDRFPVLGFGWMVF